MLPLETVTTLFVEEKYTLYIQFQKERNRIEKVSEKEYHLSIDSVLVLLRN